MVGIGSIVAIIGAFFVWWEFDMNVEARRLLWKTGLWMLGLGFGSALIGRLFSN